MLVECDIDVEILRPTLRNYPDVNATVTDLSASPDVPLRGTFVLNGSDFASFESEVEDDPTVADFTQYGAKDQYREYNVRFAESLPDVSGYQAAISQSGTVLEASSGGGPYRVKMQFPGRDSYSTFVERLSDIGLDITTRTLYESGEPSSSEKYGLTEAQQEALVTARRMGYFSFPQDATLEDVGEAIGISRTAASGRIHRGLDRLVGNTVGGDVHGERNER